MSTGIINYYNEINENRSHGKADESDVKIKKTYALRGYNDLCERPPVNEILKN